jgi:hypothetical protein
VGEALNGLVSVVHGEADTAGLVVEDLDALGLTTNRGVYELEGSRAGDDEVLGTVLVTVGVTTDDDGLLPSLDETGDTGDDNGLTEDGTTKNVTDGWG